jgi:hypothetical protein
VQARQRERQRRESRKCCADEPSLPDHAIDDLGHRRHGEDRLFGIDGLNGFRRRGGQGSRRRLRSDDEVVSPEYVCVCGR